LSTDQFLQRHEVTLEDKVAVLSAPETYPRPVDSVSVRETHMSFIFLAGDRAFKLKKPVKFPYLDFSTLERREAACRAELALNRRLARDVYIEVAPLVQGEHELAIGGAGQVIEWMVVMRRLDEADTLEHSLLSHSLSRNQVMDVLRTLASFYRSAAHVFVSSEAYLASWKDSLAYNRRILLEPALGLPGGLVRWIDQAQRGFLASRSDLIAERVRGRHIIDGHGDLRPEHIWLGDPVRIIDCLEFNARLRCVDPFDEIAFLSLECERLGSTWASDEITKHAKGLLSGGIADELFAFYRCHRAMLRARLAIAHLLEPNPRAPGKWRPLSLSYLRMAARDARRMTQIEGTRDRLRHVIEGGSMA
jgi:aminoglycoside phosphotransferase family enzyme